MASPAVATTNTSAVTSAGTSHVVNLPTSIAAGDLLIVVFALMAPTGTETISATGWTNIPSFVIRNSTLQAIHALYREADGTEGSTVTVTSSVSTKSAHTSYRITGHEDPAILAPQATTGVTGTGTNNADPPSVSVTDGPKDILSIACMALEGEVYTGTGAPTNWTNLLTANTGTAGAVGINGLIQTAQRQETNVSTVNPGVFSHASDDWAAQTIVIHPVPPTVTLSHIGPTATLFAPQVNGQIQNPHIGPIATLFDPQVNGQIQSQLIGPVATLFAPTLYGPIQLSHVGPTAVLFAPQLNSQIALAHIGPVGVVNDLSVIAVIGLSHVGPVATLFDPQLNGQMDLTHIGPVSVLNSPQLDSSISLFHIGPTAVLSEPIVSGGTESIFLPHIASTTTLNALEVGGRIQLDHIGPVATLFAFRLDGQITLTHIGPTATLFAFVVSEELGITLPSLGPLVILFAPRVDFTTTTVRGPRRNRTPNSRHLTGGSRVRNRTS